MNDVYSQISLTTVEKFRLARYVMISPNPENDAMEYMERWAKNSGLLHYPGYTPRRIGWDFPFVSDEQKNRYGLRGYVAAFVIPEEFEPSCCGAELAYQETDHYAKITVMEPFSAPFEKIAGAYGKIYEFAKERHIVARSYENRICMEEVFIKDGVTYMDVYVPVDTADPTAEETVMKEKAGRF